MLGPGWGGGGGHGEPPPPARSQVLTAAAHRECGGPGGAAQGVSQQTAGADQPQAWAQVSAQVPQARTESACFLGESPLGCVHGTLSALRYRLGPPGTGLPW